MRQEFAMTTVDNVAELEQVEGGNEVSAGVKLCIGPSWFRLCGTFEVCHEVK